jgi:hypothetical protein
LNEIIARLAATVEPPRDVIRQWQAPLDDAVALARELRGPLRHALQIAKHACDIRIFRVLP